MARDGRGVSCAALVSLIGIFGVGLAKLRRAAFFGFPATFRYQGCFSQLYYWPLLICGLWR